jgi:hypothetical protein
MRTPSEGLSPGPSFDPRAGRSRTRRARSIRRDGRQAATSLAMRGGWRRRRQAANRRSDNARPV